MNLSNISVNLKVNFVNNTDADNNMSYNQNDRVNEVNNHQPFEFNENILCLTKNDNYVPESNFEEDNFESETEVDLDKIVVEQELVELAYNPSLILFVNPDLKPPYDSEKQNHQQTNPKPQNDYEKEDKYDKILCNTSNYSQSSFAPTEVLLPISSPKSRKSITLALRSIKRKPYREPLEPLNENKCLPAENVNDNKNFDFLKETSINLNKNLMEVCADHDTNEEMNELSSSSESNANSVNAHVKFKNNKMIPSNRKRKRFANKTLKHGGRNFDFLRSIPKNKYNCKLKKREKNKILNGDGNEINSLSAEKNRNKEKPVNSCSEPLKDNLKIEEAKQLHLMNQLDNRPDIACASYKAEKHEMIKDCAKNPELVNADKSESYGCNKCDRKFKEKSHLATHERAHLEIRNFKCDRCEKTFKTKTSLLNHLKIHSGAPFVCEKCNKIFPLRRMFMRHIRIVHSCQDLYSCDQCSRKFKSTHNLNLHYTLHTGSKPFQCGICGKTFVYKSSYVAHTKAHESGDAFDCEKCLNFDGNTMEQRKVCNHHSKARPWLCTVCGKGYPLKGTLKNHMKIHEPEKPFKCSKCPKGFMKKQSLECHLKIHNGESPQYMCDQCSQSYFNLFAFRRHYLKHTSERKYICQVCKKPFWMKDALKVHMRTHNGNKMFPCSQCSKAFSHKHTLDAHMRTHGDNIQQYSCKVCQKTFVHKYNLFRHERQHFEMSSNKTLDHSIHIQSVMTGTYKS